MINRRWLFRSSPLAGEGDRRPTQKKPNPGMAGGGGVSYLRSNIRNQVKNPMTLDSAPTSIRTTCAYCGVGCGVAAQASGRDLAVHGDAEHPANGGRLCSKGTALGATFGLKGRLLEPRLRGENGFVPTDWDTALDTVAAKFRAVIDEHGPDAVAFYV